MKSWIYRILLRGYVKVLFDFRFQSVRVDRIFPTDQASWELPPRGGLGNEGVTTALSCETSGVLRMAH